MFCERTKSNIHFSQHLERKKIIKNCCAIKKWNTDMQWWERLYLTTDNINHPKVEMQLSCYLSFLLGFLPIELSFNCLPFNSVHYSLLFYSFACNISLMTTSTSVSDWLINISHDYWKSVAQLPVPRILSLIYLTLFLFDADFEKTSNFIKSKSHCFCQPEIYSFCKPIYLSKITHFNIYYISEGHKCLRSGCIHHDAFWKQSHMTKRHI